MVKPITLTREEIEEIKDEARFREKVILELKLLQGIPKKVWKLEVWSYIQWTGIFFIMVAIISKAIGKW